MSAGTLARILRPSEAARLLGVSRQTIWRLRRDPESGFPPAIRVSRAAIGFRQDELEQYIERRRGGVGTDGRDDEAS